MALYLEVMFGHLVMYGQLDPVNGCTASWTLLTAVRPVVPPA